MACGRPCGTLDFALTDEQKKALIDNGRKAGKKALMGLGQGSGAATVSLNQQVG